MDSIQQYFDFWTYSFRELYERQLDLLFGCLNHRTTSNNNWTFGVTATYLMNPVIEYKKNNIELKVDCTPFRDRYIDKFDIDKQQDTIYNIDIKQFPLQVIVDSIYGKGVYHVNDQFLNIQLKSEAGIHKDEFLKIMDEEFTIIDKVTLK